MSTMTGIPQAMRELNQWMIAGPDKNPLAISPDGFTTYRGSKSNPDQRMAYSDAMYFADELGLEVGFVTLPDDPFTIIDLDHKPDRVYDADSEAFKTSMYQTAVESTYVELSRSGLGVHIVVIGSIAHDFNAQSAGVECYCNKGFVVMTGRQVSASNEITEQQPLVEFLSEKYKGAVEASQFEDAHIDRAQIENASAEELALDQQFAESMDKWANIATIEKWMADNPGDDRSAVDMKVMQLFVKFSKGRKFPDETAIRMFMRCPRGRLLGRKQDQMQYLRRTLVGAKARVALDEKRAKDFDFAEGSRAMLQGFLDGMQPKAAEQAPSSESPAPMHMGSMGQRAPIEAPAPFNGFKWLTRTDLENQPPMEWMVKGLFPSKGVGAIYGEPGAGKSFVAIDLIAAIASGTKWFNMKTRQAPVSVFALEGEGGLRGRVKAWEMVNHREFPESVAFWDSASNGQFALRDASPVDDKYNSKRLIQLCADLIANGRRGGVVVIDTLNQASNGADENSSRDMGELLRAMKFIQRETDSLVLVVHHATKAKENQTMRGHSSLQGAMDGIMEVLREVWTTPPEGSAEKPIVIPNQRGWKAVKVKDGRDGYEKHFTMKEVDIGFDEDNFPMTSIAIQPIEEYIVDAESGELIKVPVGSLKRPDAASMKGTGGGFNGGRKKREVREAPEVTRKNAQDTPTWNGHERNVINGSHPTPPRSAKQAEQQELEEELERLPFKTAIRDALIRASKFGGSGIPIDGVPAGKTAVMRVTFVEEIKSVLNSTIDPKNPTLRKKIDSAISYAVKSGKIGAQVSGGHQYFWVLE